MPFSDAPIMGEVPRFCKDEISAVVCFLLLVPDAEAVLIPEEDLEVVACAIEKEKQMARQRVLSKDLLHAPHEAIETVMHIRRRRA